MLPNDLKSEDFKSYAPEARKLATQNLELFMRQVAPQFSDRYGRGTSHAVAD